MKKFTPAYGLKNRHLQTLYSSLFRKKIKLNFEIEKFTLEDGDFIECYWLNKKNIKKNKSIFVIFHGLAGSFESPYIQGIMNLLAKKSLCVVLVHFRGCASNENLKAKSYHSGDTSDACEYLKHLHNKNKSAKIFTIGYSLGANMLLKLLGHDFINNFIKSSICISAPLKLDVSSKRINYGFSRIYQFHLLSLLKKSLIKKSKKHDYNKLINLDIKTIKNISTIKEFDDLYTSKINNFKNAENYYKINSAKQYLKNIKTKTLIIHAIDDPFMNKEIIPTKEELSENCRLELYEKGGHLGFIEGNIFNPKYFLENRIYEYFKDDLEKIET